MMTDTPEGMTEEQDIEQARGASDMALTFALLERVHRYNPDKAMDTAVLLYRVFANIIGKEPDLIMEVEAMEAYCMSVEAGDFK